MRILSENSWQVLVDQFLKNFHYICLTGSWQKQLLTVVLQNDFDENSETLELVFCKYFSTHF